MSSDDISFQKHFKKVIIIFHSDIRVTTLIIKICTGNFLEQTKGVQKCCPQVIHTACVSKRCTTCVTSPSLLTVFSTCLPGTHEQQCTPLRVTSYVMMTKFYSCQKWDNIRNGVHMFESTICTFMQTQLRWQPHLAMEVCEGEQPLCVKI
jgi:hypothetical protein